MGKTKAEWVADAEAAGVDTSGSIPEIRARLEAPKEKVRPHRVTSTERDALRQLHDLEERAANLVALRGGQAARRKEANEAAFNRGEDAALAKLLVRSGPRQAADRLEEA